MFSDAKVTGNTSWYALFTPTRILFSVQLPSKVTLLLLVNRSVSMLHIFSSTSQFATKLCDFSVHRDTHMAGISPFFFGVLRFR